MKLFEDLEESLKKTYNTSLKESFKDIGLEEEERDKISFEISGSEFSDLNVDYSKFRNHVFFGSAYAAANFALLRIVRDYPTDGELKEKNEWAKFNTGYENWFFDNYPKQQGYLNVFSGTSATLGAWATVNDYEEKLNLKTGSLLSSFTIEGAISLNENFDGIHPIVTIGNERDQFISFYARRTNAGEKYIATDIINLQSGETRQITGSYHNFVSQSNHVATTYDKDSQIVKIYINGLLAGTGSVQSTTGSLTFNKVDVGYFNYLTGGSTRLYFSGQIDDVRIWNSCRSEELLKKNHYRTIHANHSGGLQLYWKFNEPTEYGNKIIDYSGNSLHGVLTGNLSISNNLKSGTLGSWFKDFGDPILSLENSRVASYLLNQRTSGSNYDDRNSNLIFNLVPEFFVDGEDTEYQQLFLLLVARHFDRLKLYIDHISNILKSNSEKYNGPPSNLLNLAAKHYGLDLGGVYSSASPLQSFFGEGVFSSGSLDVSINDIRDTIKKNVFSNISYLLKSKGTQQSIKGILHALGLNDNIVSISEYSDFSGGLKTTFSPKTIERRVAHFLTQSNVYVSSSAYSTTQRTIQQVRVLFNTGSSFLTQSILSVESGSLIYGARVERSNLTSSNGVLKLFVNGGTLSSSVLPFFDNKWINFTFDGHLTNPGFTISSMDRSGLVFLHSSSFVQSAATGIPQSIYLGSSGSNKFDGYMHEFRAWNSLNITSQILERWAYDWESTEIIDPLNDYSKLKTHLKLNDYTGSASGGGPIHDYAHGLSGASYFGFSSSADFNFPGKYVDKFDTSYSYDLNIDNDKIRIREGSSFSENDINYDIPFVSIDFSPVASLNKEIIKWMGNIERFSNIVSDPLFAYRDENSHLNAIRSIFFKERVNSKINYESFLELIKWFDSNFNFLLSQFIPIDLASSISNYVIEPHILEYNKVKKFVGAGAAGRTTNLESTISTTPILTASAAARELGLADPGRYGSFISSSAEVSRDIKIVYTSSSTGVNFDNELVKSVINSVSKQDIENNTPRGYGNGFYTKTITGSNYLKNTLNVNPYFAVSGVHSSGSAKPTKFLSSSHGPPTSQYTGSFSGYQDARWLWMTTDNDVINDTTNQYMIDYGIGYGGMYGQIRGRNNKSLFGKPIYPTGSTDSNARGYIGETAIISRKTNVQYVKVYNDDNLRSFIVWPKIDSYEGTEIILKGVSTGSLTNGNSAAMLGDTIDIEGYNTLNIEILGRTNRLAGGANQSQFNFELKFQFFSQETPGEYGFETVLSASRSPSNGIYKNSNVEVTYNLTTQIFPLGALANFQLGMERSLPKQKFMRVFLTVTSLENPILGSIFILTKAVLSNNEKASDELAVRDA